MKEPGFIGSDGCHWDTYQEMVFGEFRFHPYSGETEAAVLAVLKKLWDNELPKLYFVDATVLSPDQFVFEEFLMGVLSNYDLTEYGTSPRGSWLTDKGKKLLGPLFEEAK
jgi:hypothetical protein